MFGCAGVSDYTGELYIATLGGTVLDAFKKQQGDEEGIVEEEEGERERMEIKQRRREYDVAVFVARRIAPRAEGKVDEEAFKADITREAQGILTGSEDFGPAFLLIIGSALSLEADEYIGFATSFLGLDGHAARARKRVDAAAANVDIAGKGIKAASKGRSKMKEVEKWQKTEEDRMRAASQQQLQGPNPDGSAAPPAPVSEEESARLQAQQEEMVKGAISETLPLIISAAMAYNKRDVARTLKGVCKKLFNDADVDKPSRIQRARAVKILGDTFLSAGRAAAQGSGAEADMVKRAEVAVMATVGKGQGQEVDLGQMEELIREGGVEGKVTKEMEGKPE